MKLQFQIRETAKIPERQFTDQRSPQICLRRATARRRTAHRPGRESARVATGRTRPERSRSQAPQKAEALLSRDSAVLPESLRAQEESCWCTTDSRSGNDGRTVLLCWNDQTQRSTRWSRNVFRQPRTPRCEYQRVHRRLSSDRACTGEAPCAGRVPCLGESESDPGYQGQMPGENLAF